MIKLNSKQEIIGTDVVDHLGLFAVAIEKLGIAKQIDKLMPMKNVANQYGAKSYCNDSKWFRFC